MRSVVVTGASTGIGWACVKVLIGSGWRVFGSVRRQADAARLSREFGEACTPLVFDVTDADAVGAGARQVATALGGSTLSALVNNAGIAVPGPLLYLKIDDLSRQLAVNLIGPLIVTQAFAPLLGTERARSGAPGRVVMMSSVSGRNAWPFLGPYSASKFGLEGMSESLRRELMLFGIEVIIVAPGTVTTPIWDKAEQGDYAQFAGTPYAPAIEKMRDFMVSRGRRGLAAETVAEVVGTALTAPRPRTRYTVALRPLQTLLVTTLPRRLVDNAIARRLGLRRAAGAAQA